MWPLAVGRCMGLGPDRVHVAPLGSEHDRISEPAIENGADKIVLLDYLPPLPALDSIHDELESDLDDAGILYERLDCDMDDLYDAIAVFSRTIEGFASDDVYVNVATGNKKTAIAGMIACMATDAATPYYVAAEEGDSNHPRPARGVQSVEEMPSYPIDRPDYQHLAVMNYIHEAGEGKNPQTSGFNERDGEELPFRTKRELFEFGEEENLPFMSEADGASDKAKYKRLESHILSPLEDRGYVTEESVGRNKRVMLTRAGEQTLTAFRHVVTGEKPSLDL